MYVTNIRLLTTQALGLTIPAAMVHKFELTEGKAVIRPLPDGSFNVVFLSTEQYNAAMAKVGKNG